MIWSSCLPSSLADSIACWISNRLIEDAARRPRTEKREGPLHKQRRARGPTDNGDGHNNNSENKNDSNNNNKNDKENNNDSNRNRNYRHGYDPIHALDSLCFS